MANREAAPSKTPFKCIFCGGSGASAEHIWSDWMAQYFKRTPHDVHERSIAEPNGLELPKATPEDRHGHLIKKTVKAVCKTCNNGWMSQAESEAKPALTRLMFLENHSISPEDQFAIARWVMIKIFLAEWEKPSSPAFAQKERDAFFSDGSMPGNLFIDLLAYEGGTWTAALHRQAIWIDEKGTEPEIAPNGAILRNTQSVTFGIGRLIVHVFHSYTVAAAPVDDQTTGRRIWPATGVEQSWPPKQIMNSDEIKTLSTAFNDYLVGKGGFIRMLV